MFSFPVAFFSSTGGETFYKPVSRAGSGLSGTNAYDGTGTPGTTTTAATLNSLATGNTARYETYTFSGATAYTKFKLYLTYDWESNPFTDLYNDEYYGILGIEYSLNGTTWVNAPAYPEVGGGSTTYADPIDLGTLASTTITNFKVRFAAQSTRFIYDENDPFTYSYATCGFTIRDVYIGAQ